MKKKLQDTTNTPELPKNHPQNTLENGINYIPRTEQDITAEVSEVLKQTDEMPQPKDAEVVLQKLFEFFQHALATKNRVLLQLLPFFLICLLQAGCVYSPDFEQYERKEIQEVPHAKRYARERAVQRLINIDVEKAHEALDYEKDEKWRVQRTKELNAAWEDIQKYIPDAMWMKPFHKSHFAKKYKEKHHIFRAPYEANLYDSQKKRIKNHLKYLSAEASESLFERALTIFSKVRKELGIMNFDRYPLPLLEEAYQNYTNPEKANKKEVVLVIMQRKDHNDALNVEAHRLVELMSSYSLVIVETDSSAEIFHHIKKLQANGVLRKGNLKGIIIGSHANTEEISAGIETETVHSLAVLREYLVESEPLVAIAACSTAEAKDESSNIATKVALSLPEAKVIACDSFQVGLDFGLDKRKKILPKSVKMKGVKDYLSLGLLSSTVVINGKEQKEKEIQRLQKLLQEKVPESYIEACLDEGIGNQYVIKKLYEKPTTDPRDYVKYLLELTGAPTKEYVTPVKREGSSEDEHINLVAEEVLDVNGIIAVMKGGLNAKKFNEFLTIGGESINVANYVDMKISAEDIEAYRKAGVGTEMNIRWCAIFKIKPELAGRLAELGFSISDADTYKKKGNLEQILKYLENPKAFKEEFRKKILKVVSGTASPPKDDHSS